MSCFRWLIRLIIWPLGALFVLMAVRASHSEICLTKAQARQLWPKQHLYWYSKDHCWSNRRGPPKGLKMDPITNSHAEEKRVAPTVKIVRENEKNELDVEADRPKPFPFWQYHRNVDLSLYHTWYPAFRNSFGFKNRWSGIDPTTEK
jgi:hypothetical protein